METTDAFDDFLKDKFSNTETIEDNGFSAEVMSHLPKRKKEIDKKPFVILLAGVLSILIFIISSGYKILVEAIIDVLQKIIQLEKPNSISLIIIAVFFGLSIFISRTAHNNKSILF